MLTKIGFSMNILYKNIALRPKINMNGFNKT